MWNSFMNLIMALASLIFPQESNKRPRILSTLYGYDDCIGGVNNFNTDEEYMEDLKRRNCTVVKGPDGKDISNVGPATSLKLGCMSPFQSLEWMDGMPVTFNFPLVETPDKEAIQVELSDGTKTSPVCVMMGPANEANEMDTLLILGQFGDGRRGSVWPVRVSVVGEVLLSGPDGELDAQGISYSSPEDMRYDVSSVRMIYARMWDVEDFQEGNRYPLWPLPSSTYPNSCESLYPSTTHVIRAAFSGGITMDGVISVSPQDKNIFTLKTGSTSKEVPYLGLADLGKTVSIPQGELYDQDGDNYLDICLDLTQQPGVVTQDLVLQLHCDQTKGSALYPPKGQPYACKPQEVTLTEQDTWGYFIKTWIYSP